MQLRQNFLLFAFHFLGSVGKPTPDSTTSTNWFFCYSPNLNSTLRISDKLSENYASVTVRGRAAGEGGGGGGGGGGKVS